MHLLALDSLALGLILRYAMHGRMGASGLCKNMTYLQYVYLVCTHVCKRFHRELSDHTWIRPRNPPEIYWFPARQGHLSVIRWLWETYHVPLVHPFEIADRVCSFAVDGGHLNVLEWLLKHGDRPNSWTYAYAAERGHLHVLQWLETIGVPRDSHMISSYAARGGHLYILEWLRSLCGKNTEWHPSLYSFAANKGHINVLEWIKENTPLDCDDYACTSAAAEGHLDVLKWLKKHNAPWRASTCMLAAQGGHLNVLQWLVSNGSPFNPEACRKAASIFGHEHVIKWLESKQ